MRRLLNKKGSVLFLVLVVMSLLIIAASATYYVVSNQRSSVNIRYSSEQSYQTAMSMSETVSSYIDSFCGQIGINGNVEGIKDHESNIITQMLKLEDGKSFSTDKIDFSNIAMGNAEIKITKVKSVYDEESGKTDHYFDIATEAVVNDERVTITQTKLITTAKHVEVADPFTKFLTSTGKANEPYDTYIRTGSIYGEVFFDNEYSSIDGRVNTSLYSTGTFTDNGIQYQDAPAYAPTLEMVIAENFITESGINQPVPFSNVFVGRDMILDRSWEVKRTYVMGNLTIKNLGINGGQTFFVQGDAHLTIPWGAFSHTIYVKNDLYIEYSDDWHVNVLPNLGTYYVGGKVFLKGQSDSDWYEYTGEVGSYSDNIADAIKNSVAQNDGDPFEINNWEDVQAYINKKAAKQAYIEWDAEEYFDNTLNEFNNLPVIIPGSDGARTVEITDHCTLKASSAWRGDYGGTHDIIIDTEKAGKPIYIKLKPADGDSAFSFIQKDPNVEFGAELINVIIKGPYSVIFILPRGVDFATNNNSFIGHEGIAVGAANSLNGTSFNSYEELKAVQPYLYSNFFKGGYNSIISNNIKSMIKLTSEGHELLSFDGMLGGTHNNIFLVSMGNNNKLNFDAEATFCGYVYAPYSDLTCNGSSQKIAFIGGVVVNSYTYIDAQSNLIFTTPYDYSGKHKPGDMAEADYNKADIVKLLMGLSGAKVPGAENGDITILSGWQTIGYR